MSEANTLTDNTIIVVVGVRRSGTSILMQMLEAAGLPCFYDESTPANQHNINGFYDHKATRNINKNHYFLDEVKGQCIKIPAAGIPFLPVNKYKYKFLFIERNFVEVILSLNKMNPNTARHKLANNVYPSNVIERFIYVNILAKNWISKHNQEVLFIDHRNLINDAQNNAEKINNFLGGKLDVAQMANVVDKDLYRTKNDRELIRTDRAPANIQGLLEQYAKDKIYCEIGIGNGHVLNALQGAKKKYGVEENTKLYNNCRALYPHLKCHYGTFQNVYEGLDFEVCYMWIVYPHCKEIIDIIIAELQQCRTIIFGLNYYYHLEESDPKFQKYIKHYPEMATAKDWNKNINAHLAELKEAGYSISIEEVKDEDSEEIFSVAIVQLG